MGRYNRVANFYEFPSIPSDAPLPPWFSLVIPTGDDRTNQITNPSFETNSTNWSLGGGGAINRVTSFQWAGTYALSIVPSGVTTQAIYGATTPLSLTLGNLYAASLRFLCPTGGLPFDFYVATTGNVRLTGIPFKSTGFWQWIWFPYAETSTASRRLIVATNGVAAQSRTAYIDAIQFEQIPSGQLAFPTTYIDGDQLGLTPNEFPPPYYWTGTPHASTSVRRGTTRSGGKVVNLRDLGLMISVVSGLGLPSPQVVSLPLGQLDGEVYERTRKEARTFSIAGRIQGRSLYQLDQNFGGLSNPFDRDATSRDEPFLLKYQPMDEQETPTGVELTIPSVYMGGFDGQRNNQNAEVFTATFKQHVATMLGHFEGAQLNTSTSVTNANGIIRRSVAGTWSSLNTGLSGGGVTAAWVITQHPNGTIYVGGDFTNAGGSGADYAAIYDPKTDTFSVIKAATTFNSVVIDIIVSPDPDVVYFAGDFINADGIANADRIVKYTISTNTFAALGTGALDNAVWGLAFDLVGNLYAAGTFSQMGGVANTGAMAMWNGTVWSALGTGVAAAGPGNGANCIAAVGSNIYFGGNFLNAGGVAAADRLAKWDGTAVTALSTGADNQVLALRTGPDGNLYVGGAFTTLGGIALRSIGKWNGVTFNAVGSPTALPAGSFIEDIVFAPDGTMYVGGTFASIFSVAYPSGLARFDGSTFIPVDIDLPGTGEDVIGLEITSDGTLYAGFNTTGTANAPGLTTVSHSGTARTFSVLTLIGAGVSRIYSITNYTTGRVISLNYTIQNGERAKLTFDPLNLSFVSSFFGDISNTILIGSQEADFFLARGQNIISVLASGGAATAEIYWRQAFLSASDAAGKV